MHLPGSTPVTAPEPRSRPESDVSLIDCDVHHWLKNLDQLHPYLSLASQRQVKEQGFLFPGSGYFNEAETEGNQARISSTILAGY